MNADLLIGINLIGFPGNSITFKSGIVSPVYIDNRKLPSYPRVWKTVLRELVKLIEREKLIFDIVAGIETAGIPHSAALGYILGVPSVFVRKQVKGHGTKKLVEGGEVTGKSVLLVEDHISTGGSSLAGVKALRDAGAIVNDCLAITSFDLAESHTLFKREKVRLHILVPFEAMLQAAKSGRLINEEKMAEVKAWQKDPWGWGLGRG